MMDLSILSVIWQISFPSSGTFALCDGDFSRWDFYSGPRYGVATAGGDTPRNAWPGGGASLRVSGLIPCGETGCRMTSVSGLALCLVYLMKSNYFDVQVFLCFLRLHCKSIYECLSRITLSHSDLYHVWAVFTHHPKTSYQTRKH